MLECTENTTSLVEKFYLGLNIYAWKELLLIIRLHHHRHHHTGKTFFSPKFLVLISLFNLAYIFFRQNMSQKPWLTLVWLWFFVCHKNSFSLSLSLFCYDNKLQSVCTQSTILTHITVGELTNMWCAMMMLSLVKTSFLIAIKYMRNPLYFFCSCCPKNAFQKRREKSPYGPDKKKIPSVLGYFMALQ